MPLDTLTLARELRAASIEPAHAEAIAAAIGRAVVETAATKADLTSTEMRVLGEIAELRVATKADLMQSATELRAAIAASEARLDAKIVELRGQMATNAKDAEKYVEKESRVILQWIIGVGIGLGGLMIALLGLTLRLTTAS